MILYSARYSKSKPIKPSSLMLRTTSRMPLAYNNLMGATGRQYIFQQMIQDRSHLGRIWLATSGNEKFVLKDMPIDILTGFNEKIRPRLPNSQFIRLPTDDIPNERIVVYRYLVDDFLDLVKGGISKSARKQVLKASLRGLISLHDQDIVHLDIKPDDILVDYRYTGDRAVVEKVELGDLENAGYLPKGRCIKGMLAGNENWRSPEAHFKGELNKPSDIFSFGLVCIYAMLERVVIGPDEDFYHHEAQGALPAMIRLQRQVSYFGDRDGLNGLMTHVSDEEINCQLLGILWDERNEDYIPYKPFSTWNEIEDVEFKDLVLNLTNLDPAKRITARQALDHAWFRGIEDD